MKKLSVKMFECINDNQYICPYCENIFSKRAICGHVWRNHTKEGKNFNPNKGYKDGTRQAWNKGLTKETNEKVRKGSETLKKRYDNGELEAFFKNKHHSEKTIKILKQKCGGYRKGSGRGKQGKYCGIWCDSSWELAFLIYCLEHEIPIKRNKQYFLYTYENQQHKYYPDFIIKNEIYVEIKGYETEKDKMKYKNFYC